MLVVGHNHSRTKTPNSKKLKFQHSPMYYIGFRICEIPKKYSNEYEEKEFNLKGYSYYPVIDFEDYDRY